MAVKWSNASPGDTGLDCVVVVRFSFAAGAQVGTTGYVYGVDFSPQLAIAQKRSQHHTPHPISWIEADVLDYRLLTTTSMLLQWAMVCGM